MDCVALEGGATQSISLRGGDAIHQCPRADSWLLRGFVCFDHWPSCCGAPPVAAITLFMAAFWTDCASGRESVRAAGSGSISRALLGAAAAAAASPEDAGLSIVTDHTSPGAAGGRSRQPPRKIKWSPWNEGGLQVRGSSADGGRTCHCTILNIFPPRFFDLLIFYRTAVTATIAIGHVVAVSKSQSQRVHRGETR